MLIAMYRAIPAKFRTSAAARLPCQLTREHKDVRVAVQFGNFGVRACAEKTHVRSQAKTRYLPFQLPPLRALSYDQALEPNSLALQHGAGVNEQMHPFVPFQLPA